MEKVHDGERREWGEYNENRQVDELEEKKEGQHDQKCRFDLMYSY